MCLHGLCPPGELSYKSITLFMNVASSQYLPLSHGRNTIFLSSKQNHFEIAISCFDKFCVGNATLTLTAALCGPALRYIVRHVKRKVFLGNLKLEYILFYFHNLNQTDLLFELEKKSSLVTCAPSTKSCTHDTDSRHSCTRLTPRVRMTCLYHNARFGRESTRTQT